MVHTLVVFSGVVLPAPFVEACRLTVRYFHLALSTVGMYSNIMPSWYSARLIKHLNFIPHNLHHGDSFTTLNR